MITMRSLVTIYHHTKIPHKFPHSAHCIPKTHLFCRWKFIPLHLPHWFFSFPHCPTNHLFILCIYNSVLLCLFSFFFRFYTYMKPWRHVFLWLISLSMILSRSICVVANGKILFILFLWLSNIPVCVCVCVYTISFLSIHLLMGT